MKQNAKNAAPMRPPFGGSRAFTLAELLTVIAIIGVMMAAGIPAFQAMKQDGDVTRAAYEISGALEAARAYAMAKGTYVFVGFAERDGSDPARDGTGQIVMVTFGSKDGSRDFGTGHANLTPLSGPRRITNLRLEDGLPNSGAMSRPVVQEAYRMASEAFAAPEAITHAGYELTKVIQFTPRGAAGVPARTTLIPQWMEIGLTADRGGAAGDDRNGAVVMLDGVTGSTKIYRP